MGKVLKFKDFNAIADVLCRSCGAQDFKYWDVQAAQGGGTRILCCASCGFVHRDVRGELIWERF